MDWLWTVLAAVAAVCAVTVLIAYICYRMAFYAPPRKERDPDVIDLPEGEAYRPFRDSMEKWARQTRQMPHEEMVIKSYDGLTLRGNYYEFAPGAPIELMFHGYRGNGERDLSGGVQRCFRVGRSALIVDQRGSGNSEGKVLTFGIREHKDCLEWIDFIRLRFGEDVKIILTGISMGAATVLMAAGEQLPENVIGVLADCGYSSPRSIIRKVIRQMHLPVNLAYPFVRLGGRLFGGFDLEENAPEEAMKKCAVPAIFFHGGKDNLVPWGMSRRNYEACTAKKKLVIVPEADHGLSYVVAPELYLKELREFFGPEASYGQQ